MVRTLERVVEQIVDIRETQVTEKTTKIPKITQQVCEHTVPTADHLIAGYSETLNKL